MIEIIRSHQRRKSLRQQVPHPDLKLKSGWTWLWPRSYLRQINFDFERVAWGFETNQSGGRRTAVFDFYRKKPDDGARYWSTASLVEVASGLDFRLGRETSLVGKYFRGLTTDNRERIQLTDTYSLHVESGHALSQDMLDDLRRFVAKHDFEFALLRNSGLLMEGCGHSFFPDKPRSILAWMWWLIETEILGAREYEEPRAFWNLLDRNIELAELIEKHQ
ncbi:MAG: hypothetical protein AAFX06_00425 [Planctomycetota bacterium]